MLSSAIRIDISLLYHSISFYAASHQLLDVFLVGVALCTFANKVGEFVAVKPQSERRVVDFQSEWRISSAEVNRFFSTEQHSRFVRRRPRAQHSVCDRLPIRSTPWIHAGRHHKVVF